MRKTAFHNITSYLLAGKLLHIISLIEIMVILMVIPSIYRWETSTIYLQGLKLYTIAYLLSLPLLSQLDARSRYQNYKQIKDQIYIYGFDTRILKPIIRSRCQRDAALLSASDLGYRNHCKKHFRSSGYKWYHLLPDFIFTKPQFLLSKYFWKTTFFTPTYKSKINYLVEDPKTITSNQNFEINEGITSC